MKRNSLVRTPVPYIFAVLFASILIFAACKRDAVTVDPPEARIKIATDATLGTHFTDTKGASLYYFAQDLEGPKCTGGCLLVWPPFYDSLITSTTLPTGLNAADFTTITLAGTTTKQTVYKGWPLYYYAPKDAVSGLNVRELPGEVKGEKVGKTWYVIKPDYTLMLGNKRVANVTTGDTVAKQFLIDKAGLTLYYFKKDELKPDSLSINCINGCIATWPVYYQDTITVPSLMNKADFGFIIRNDGPGGTQRKQSTYKGRPLYYFTPDATTKAVTKGEGVGNSWYVVNPDIAPLR